MTSDKSPTLSEDEATLAQYGSRLGDAFEAVAPSWLRRLVDARMPGLSDSPDVRAELDAAAQVTVAKVRELLQLDIGEQPMGPLEVLRRAVQFPTSVLAANGLAPVERDSFATTNFPADVYDLTPASFAAVDPSLQEPGLMWGAAKAHVHLRRRRERDSPPPAPAQAAETEATSRGSGVVVLSVDLMDRSKISAAYPEAVLVRSVAKLLDVAADASLVLVDLGRLDDPAALADIAARVVAFGSHVDDQALAAAEAVGAEALPRSVFFRRLELGEI